MRRVGLVAALIASAAGAASSDPAKPKRTEIELTLEPLHTDVAMGKPILVTVVFRNNLKRDIRIEGFNPEAGSSCSARMVAGKQITHRTVKSTTDVRVERLLARIWRTTETLPFPRVEIDRLRSKPAVSRSRSSM